jgi:hypothetical protein
MSKNSVVTLRATAVRFLSQQDEAAFFQWLGKLQEYASVCFEGDTLVIDVETSKMCGVRGEDLRELIALFFRYGIDMRQLRAFETRSNRSWLANQRAYWHSAMYESVPTD